MAYRTLESVLHPDSHLTLPSAELPLRPRRVMVTILEDDEATGQAKRLQSPRLVHPEQAVDFKKEAMIANK